MVKVHKNLGAHASLCQSSQKNTRVQGPGGFLRDVDSKELKAWYMLNSSSIDVNGSFILYMSEVMMWEKINNWLNVKVWASPGQVMHFVDFLSEKILQ